MHVWYVLVYFAYSLDHWLILGYLLEKGPKLVPFWSKSDNRNPSKKASKFRLPLKLLNSSIWKHLGAQWIQKVAQRAILDVFLAAFLGPVGIVIFDTPL